MRFDCCSVPQGVPSATRVVRWVATRSAPASSSIAYWSFTVPSTTPEPRYGAVSGLRRSKACT